MAEDVHSKTEAPTPKRREEARTQGNIPKSTEITSSAILLASVVAASVAGDRSVTALETLLQRTLLAASARDLTLAHVVDLVHLMTEAALTAVAPLLGLTLLVAVAANVAQVGFGFYPKRLKPELSRISPASGLQRLFSLGGLANLVKAVLKIGIVFWIGWTLVRAVERELLALPGAHPEEILVFAGVQLRWVVTVIALALAALAVLDYLYQRWEQERNLRMTRQEVKDERRQMEPDPQIRQRIRHAYQEIAKVRSLADVPTADVVITNPVHVAVALRYVAGKMSAPVVVAKGAETLAERIKDVARRHGVPIVERRALARALFRTVQVGQEIPATLYRAVASILAYIYGLRQRKVG